MIDINKLRAKIVEAGMTVKDVSDAMGINPATLYRKMANDGAHFTVKELQIIVETLKLSKTEILDIFFKDEVTK